MTMSIITAVACFTQMINAAAIAAVIEYDVKRCPTRSYNRLSLLDLCGKVRVLFKFI